MGHSSAMLFVVTFGNYPIRIQNMNFKFNVLVFLIKAPPLKNGLGPRSHN